MTSICNKKAINRLGKNFIKKTRLFGVRIFHSRKPFVASVALVLFLFYPAMTLAQAVESTEVVTPSLQAEGGETLSGTEQIQSDLESESDQPLTFPYKQTFLISAYYSPLDGQEKYATGSYDGDIRLNGRGVRGADGTAVYPGMIAAPKIYPFGTKMYIPGIGTVAVHDRGGAIVPAGERNQTYDRLDIWMGYGDAGLQRALHWGKRVVEVTVYGIDSSIQEEVYLEGYSEEEKYLESNPGPLNSGEGEVVDNAPGKDIISLQQSLQVLGLYSGEINGELDKSTRAALINFQKQAGIIRHENDFGAGYFGPKTHQQLVVSLKTGMVSSQPEFAVVHSGTQGANSQFFSRDLELGDRGQDVYRLQQELIKVHLLAVEPTGYYGEVTGHAVLKFQQNLGIVADEHSSGAGVFNEVTRKSLNKLVAERLAFVATKKQKANSVLAATP